jgi:PBP1b-binding outer membrane lipoprotein LpoB
MNKKIISILVVLLIAFLLFGCTSSSSDNTNTTTNNTNNTTAQTKEYSIGESFTLGNIEYKVNSLDEYPALGSEYMNKIATDGATFYLIDLTMKNNGNKEESVLISNDVLLIDSQNREYKVDNTASMYAGQTGFETIEMIEKIPAGLSKTGVIVFEVPEGTTGKLKIKPSFFSEESYVKLD